MASNLLSRLLPAAGSPSVYETLQQHDQSSDASDVEDRAGMALDEENLGHRFEDYDLDHAQVEGLGDSPLSDHGAPLLNEGTGLQDISRTKGKGLSGQPTARPKWLSPPPVPPVAEEGDDEVPASLLIEDREDAATIMAGKADMHADAALSFMPPPPSAEEQVPWNPVEMHPAVAPKPRTRKTGRGRLGNGLAIIEPRERAMWRWANVENLDNFLKDVYDYYLGNGIWSIILSRALNLLTLAFVVGFSTFLTMCIDYKKVPQSKTMSQILVPQCARRMSGTASFLIWLFAFSWVAKLLQYVVDVRRLRHLHDFYLYLLDIPDSDIQTISWQEVVTRLMSLRDANPVTADGIGAKQRRFLGSQSKQRMGAHDIANRLMRKENYLIALFNKEILDLTLPIPLFRNRQLFSKTLEWNLSYCILDFVFNEQGQVRPLFLRDTHRRALCDGLRRRFLFAGFMNVICAPFIVVYLIMLYFFRYFTEYQKNPSQIGSRQYTPLAEWKFREFNELWHLFQRRLNMSYPYAARYVDQFPKDKTVQLSRFVAFITGALAAVLALASVVDPELFLGFEITHERTVLFYLGVFGTVWAVARGAVPEETLVFDPEFALNNVVEYTHYLPAHWRGRLHSDDVRKEFSLLYQMKVVIFLEEILSLIFTPFILWFSLPKCSERIVDFFREFTIHVDGLGYVCSFAVFDFKRAADGGAHLRPRHAQGQAAGLREDYYSTKDGKMLASFYGFLDNYSSAPRQAGGAMRTQTSSRRPPVQPRTSNEIHAAGVSPRQRAYQASARSVLATSTMQAARRPGPASRTGLGGAELSSAAQASRFPVPHLASSSMAGPSRQRVQHRQRPSEGRPTRADMQGAEAEPVPLISQPGGGGGGGGVASSGSADGTEDEGHLGESWKTTRAAAVGDVDEGDEGHIDGIAGDKEVGVLGLLYQFQRAQVEGRGGGVVI